VALGAAGAWHAWRTGARDVLTLALVALAAAAVGSAAGARIVGIPLDTGAAAVPLIALLAGRGSAMAWVAGGWPRAAAGILLAWCAWTGVATWWSGAR